MSLDHTLLTTTATPAVKRDGKDINESSAYPDNVLPIQ